MLVCNATTLEEFRKEIVSLLHYRAAQERAVIGITSNAKRDAIKHEHAAIALDNLARDVERMEIVNAWPSGLRETPVPSFPVPHPFEASEVNPGTCGVCGKVEVYNRMHKFS